MERAIFTIWVFSVPKIWWKRTYDKVNSKNNYSSSFHKHNFYIQILDLYHIWRKKLGRRWEEWLMISQANTTKSPPYGSFFRKHCWYLRFKSADALTSDLDELNIHHELLHLSSAILVKGSLAVRIMLGTMKWHLTKAWAQQNRERSVWEGRVQEYWPKLVF